MKEKTPQLWIPLYVDKWLFGSTRLELSPDERGVFVDFLVLAAKDDGYLRANETTPYLPVQIAGLLNISVDLLQSTIVKCLAVGKLEEAGAGIYKLKNWDKYQFSRQYIDKRNHRLQNCNHSLQKCRPIRKDRIGQDKKGEDISPLSPQGAVVADKRINWENCKTPQQILAAHYLKRYSPDIYKEASQIAANAFFSRNGKALTDICHQCGNNVPAILAAFDLCARGFEKNKLSWTLDTMAKHITDYYSKALRKVEVENDDLKGLTIIIPKLHI